MRWFGAVAKQVGGVVEYRTLGGRGGETFVRVPEAKQRAAVKFLIENAFTTPTKLLDPKIVNQFKYSGVANEVASQQRSLLSSLLSSSRLNRLFDSEVLNGDKAYTVVELVTDVQNGVFSELKDQEPKIDPLRRILQRSYIDILSREFRDNAPTPSGPIGRALPINESGGRLSELRAVARVALKRLDGQVAAAQEKAKDIATVAHLEDVRAQIRDILEQDKK
jgi:hypothetical protein